MLRLTQKEKLCFWGLVRYPTLNDNDLSAKIGLKRSTITAIRNKLKKDRYFSTIVIPCFRQLGCELISVMYGEFNNRVEFHKEIFSELLKRPNIVYAYVTDTNFFLGFIEKNYTNFAQDNNEILDLFEEKAILRTNSVVHFPLDITTTIKMADFSGILKKIFNLDVNNELEVCNPNILKLSNKEKLVLNALVKYPDKTDTFISEQINIARPTISSIKKKFLENNVIKVTNIPNLEKMPFEIMTLCHMKFNHKFKEFANFALQQISPYQFCALGIPRHVFTLSLYTDYTVYNTVYQGIHDAMTSHDLLRGDPNKLLLSLKEPYKRKLDFSKLTELMLLGEK